jgi:MYXO-CTERM domain-containing protein
VCSDGGSAADGRAARTGGGADDLQDRLADHQHGHAVRADAAKGDASKLADAKKPADAAAGDAKKPGDGARVDAPGGASDLGGTQDRGGTAPGLEPGGPGSAASGGCSCETTATGGPAPLSLLLVGLILSLAVRPRRRR